MDFTIEELKEHQQYWEAHLINLARLPPHKDKEVQEVRDGRIQFAIERVRDIHVQLCELEAEMEASKNKLASHGIMFG